MASIPSQQYETSLDSSGSLQSSCDPSPSVQTRSYKREVSRNSDNSDVLPADSDSSNTVGSKRESKSSEGSSSKGEGKVDKAGDRPNKKKSSWYNVLYPTYKTRSESFKRIFKELPADERLVVDYSCALQRDILVHGRLYVSPNYLSFYANIFGWETSVSVPWRQVSGLTKEKTALVIPNAIQVSTGNNERLFFTSFGARDKTFLMLFRIWQNALLDQNVSSQELWQWVHACYGDELGLTSDDEDYVSSTGLEDEQNNPIACTSNLPALDLSLRVGDLPPLELQLPFLPGSATADLCELAELAATCSSPLTPSIPQICNMPVQETVSTMVTPVTPETSLSLASSFMTPTSDVLHTDLSDTTESDVEKTTIVNPVCPGPHEGRQSVDAVFPIPVDQLFALLFTTSTFFVAFHTARKTYDIQASAWQPNKETGLKCRQVAFTISLNQAVGPKTSQVTETQNMLAISRPGRIYVIDVEANNAGIPYADSFYLSNHFCLVRVSDSQCRLCVYSQIKYRKSVWGLVKGFIEKNTWAGVEDFYSSLCRALNAEAEALIAGEATSAGKRKTRTVRHRRTRAHHRSSSNGDSVAAVISSGDISPTARSPLVAQLVGSLAERGAISPGIETGGIWSWAILITLLALLLLNAVLYHKLWGLEAWGKEASLGRIELPIFKNPPESHDEWLRLLQQQEMLHRREMENWQNFLETAVSLLRQAEEALEQLQSTITPDLLNLKSGSMWSSDGGSDSGPNPEL